MLMNKLAIAAASVCLLLGNTAFAQEQITFAYASPEAMPTPVGSLRVDNYDVAIALTNPSLYGMSITEIEVPVMPCDLVTDMSIWMSHELKLKAEGPVKVNVPDVSYPMTMPVDGEEIEWVKLSLDEPYVIPDGGLYVGYSFKVTEIDDTRYTRTPVVATAGNEPGSLWLHTTKTYRSWMDQSEALNAISMVQVKLVGNTMPGDALRFGEILTRNVAVGMDNTLDVMVYNMGTNPISSIGYTSTVGDASYDGMVQLTTPLSPTFGYAERVTFKLPEIKAAGNTEVMVEVTSINGVPVSGVTAKCQLNVAAFVPKHIAVVEEYTGMWCGNCPRGFVAMEKMGEWYPDFIGIAYHNNDALAMESGDPGMTGAYPSAFIDRQQECDPYYADPASSTFSLPTVWAKYCDEFSPVAVEVEAQWDADSRTVTAVSTVNWAVVPDDADDADYRIEYVLVADDLTSPTWYQVNYYAGNAKGTPEYMEEFCNAGSYVLGLHYNDVAMMTSGFKGIAGSIPSLAIDQPTSHTYVFDTNQAYTAGGERFPFSPDKLRVVAMVLKNNTVGQIVNAAKCNVIDNSGIPGLAIDCPPVETVYYDLDGRQMTEPEGLCIRQTRYADGTVTHSKVIVR